MRARLPPLGPGPKTHNRPSGTTRCTTRCCTHCLRLDRSSRITSLTTGRSYVAMRNVTCKSSNLIYCLTCRHCGQQYVGQTQQTLMKRVYAHIYSINTRGETSVARHFNSNTHRGVTDLATHIVEFVHPNPGKKETQSIRDTLELKWIHCLRTVFPLGMNVIDTRFSTV